MAALMEMIQSLDALPSLPGPLLRVSAMLSSGEADPDELRDIVANDEALTMAILKAANSALYGAPGRVFNLRESIVRLGSKTLMKIVMQQQASDLFAGGGEAFGLRRGALWRGALGGAVAAERLAERHGLSDTELCYLCALLRDVGKLVLDVQFGTDYISQVRQHATPEISFVEAERQTFEFDHAVIGAELARHWGLPERICDAIRYHHDPPGSAPSHDVLFDVVHAADLVAMWAGLAIGDDGLQYALAPHVRVNLGLCPRDAESDIAATWARVMDLEEAMHSTDTPRRSA